VVISQLCLIFFIFKVLQNILASSGRIILHIVQKKTLVSLILMQRNKKIEDCTLSDLLDCQFVMSVLFDIEYCSIITFNSWMTGKEVVKSVSLNTPLRMTIRKFLGTYDTTSTVKFNLMENIENQTPC
jgi:hypothetical protein